MKAQANIKYLKISARKLRLSADLVRGLRVAQAEQVLAATPTKGATMVAEALKSVVANAENNQNARKSTLIIAEIKVNEGPTLKRFRPRSRGMAAPILHRMSHLQVVVTDEAKPEKKRAAKKPQKASRKQLTTTGKEA
jgi:large subunit ribosomal protein L22